MKILFLLHWHLYYTAQLANAISKNGCKVHIICREHLGEIDKKSSFLFLKKHLNKEIQYSTFVARPKNPMDLFLILNLFRLIKKIKPRIIHVHESSEYRICFLLFLVKLVLKKVQIFLTIHDCDTHIGESRSRLKECFRKGIICLSDKIICHGVKIKNHLVKVKIKEKKIIIIPHGAYTIYRRYNRIKVKEEKNSILFFGRIYKYKGLEYLVKAETYIKKEIPDIKIIIAGTGPDLDNYQRKIENNESYILYNRYITNGMIAKLFQRASIIVLPYIEASQSGVLAIAYAFGKPVVATNVGSIPEVVDDGKTGYIVPPKDSIRLAKAIVGLLKNEEKRKEMGGNAYRKATTDLSWDNIAQKTIKVYRDNLNLKW